MLLERCRQENVCWSGEQHGLVQRALKGALENTLVGVSVKEREKMSPDKMLELFSLPWSATAFVRRSQYLAERGIRFVGEWYYVKTRKNSPADDIGEFLQSALDLPVECDPLALGWRPPYWDDASFKELLDQPLNTVHNNKGYEVWWYYSRGFRYVGEFLARRREANEDGKLQLSPGALQQHQESLADTQLWAGMLLPPKWEARLEDPRDYAEAMATMKEDERKRRLARIHLR